MDIEEYLRQKRELEAKKEMLEAKEKVVDHEKERFKKEQRAKIYAEHGVTPKHTASEHQEFEPHHTYRPPSSGPGMWNTLLLFLILILLVVTYLLPRFGEPQIRELIQQESEKNNVNTEEEENNEIVEEVEKEPIEEEEEELIVPQGPIFTMSVKDNEEGLFDDDGKIDGEILVLNIQSGLKYYEDFTLTISNKETDPIVCKLDRKVEIDTDFDGTSDIEDNDVDRFKIELDPKSSKSINSDVVPGTVERGIYEGTGYIRTTYETRCYYCEDVDCNKIDESAESIEEAFFRVSINKDAFLNNSTS